MINWLEAQGGHRLPCIATPRGISSREISCAALTEWVGENASIVREKLEIHGAVLFRGFSFDSVGDFDKFADVFCPVRQDYIGGNSPRTKVKGGIYTATEYPNDAKISLHNEASYLRSMPVISFFTARWRRSTGDRHHWRIAERYFKGSILQFVSALSPGGLSMSTIFMAVMDLGGRGGTCSKQRIKSR
jgi:hypothetical protein